MRSEEKRRDLAMVPEVVGRLLETELSPPKSRLSSSSPNITHSIATQRGRG
jgi:hypothetical protein